MTLNAGVVRRDAGMKPETGSHEARCDHGSDHHSSDAEYARPFARAVGPRRGRGLRRAAQRLQGPVRPVSPRAPLHARSRSEVAREVRSPRPDRPLTRKHPSLIDLARRSGGSSDRRSVAASAGSAGQNATGDDNSAPVESRSQPYRPLAARLAASWIVNFAKYF